MSIIPLKIGNGDTIYNLTLRTRNGSDNNHSNHQLNLVLIYGYICVFRVDLYH